MMGLFRKKASKMEFRKVVTYGPDQEVVSEIHEIYFTGPNVSIIRRDSLCASIEKRFTDGVWSLREHFSGGLTVSELKEIIVKIEELSQ